MQVIKAWSVSSEKSRFEGCMSMSLVYWQWKASKWTHLLDNRSENGI